MNDLSTSIGAEVITLLELSLDDTITIKVDDNGDVVISKRDFKIENHKHQENRELGIKLKKRLSNMIDANTIQE